jgi:SAM-dependent methyltransferase
MERHRVAWVWLTRSGLLDGDIKSVAHFAPEPAIESQLRRRLPGARYVTADLMPGRAQEQVDVTRIPWPDGSVDLLICSHVLEHVPDDRAALRELRRVLAAGGIALLDVPVIGEVTREDPTVNDPAERLRLFGQDDHVRVYGRDYYHRLREAGFVDTHNDARAVINADERKRFGLVHHVDFAGPEDDTLWDVVVCRPG